MEAEGVPVTASFDPYALGTSVRPQVLDAPKTFFLPDWDRLTHPQKIAVLRKIAEPSGKDPRVRQLLFAILQDAKVDSRDYDGQAAAILAWVQTVIGPGYINEPDEVLQDPLYTVSVRAGDCDDFALLLGALFQAAALPWKFVLSGRDARGRKIRWLEGDRLPWGKVDWQHIYNAVGNHPFKPTSWKYAEGTVKNAPLGWDVVAEPVAPGILALAPASVQGLFGYGVSSIPASDVDNEPAFFSKATGVQIGVYVVAGFFSAIAGAIAIDLYNRTGLRRRLKEKGVVGLVSRSRKNPRRSKRRGRR